MIIRDRVAQVTNASGIGDVTLDGTVAGFLTFQAQVPTGVALPVLVKDGDAFEVFEAVLNSGTPYTLTRGPLIRSSTGSRINLTNLVNKPVYLLPPAEAYGPMGGRSSFALTSGTAPDYTAIFAAPIRALKDGTRCTVIFHAVNPTAPVTFAPDGLTAKPVKAGRPLRTIAPNRLPAALMADLEFSETDDCWIVLSALPTGVTKTISGTTYTVLEEDHGIRLIFTSASAVAVTVPQATGQFAAPFEFSYLVAGAGTVTFTPTTSTINGVATLGAGLGSAGVWFADGGNYRSTTSAGGFLTNAIHGLKLANNATDTFNDIDISAGFARDAGDTDTMVLTSTLTKRLDAAWVVGTNQGGLDTGSKASGTWYHLWAIKRPDTGVVDALFSASATAPTMPTNYTLKRRLGSVLTNGSGSILAFFAVGDGAQRDYTYTGAPPIDVNVAAPGTSAVSRTLSTPAGVITKARVSAAVWNNGTTTLPILLLSSLAQADVAPDGYRTSSLGNGGGQVTASNDASAGWSWGELSVWTDTNSAIRSRFSVSDATTRIAIVTRGWSEEV